MLTKLSIPLQVRTLLTWLEEEGSGQIDRLEDAQAFAYYNGRERGFSLVFQDDNRQLVFVAHEHRNSDCLVIHSVLLEKPDDFVGVYNVPNSDFLEKHGWVGPRKPLNGKEFNYGSTFDAVEFIRSKVNEFQAVSC